MFVTCSVAIDHKFKFHFIPLNLASKPQSVWCLMCWDGGFSSTGFGGLFPPQDSDHRVKNATPNNRSCDLYQIYVKFVCISRFCCRQETSGEKTLPHSQLSLNRGMIPQNTKYTLFGTKRHRTCRHKQQQWSDHRSKAFIWGKRQAVNDKTAVWAVFRPRGKVEQW